MKLFGNILMKVERKYAEGFCEGKSLSVLRGVVWHNSRVFCDKVLRHHESFIVSYPSTLGQCVLGIFRESGVAMELGIVFQV